MLMGSVAMFGCRAQNCLEEDEILKLVGENNYDASF